MLPGGGVSHNHALQVGARLLSRASASSSAASRSCSTSAAAARASRASAAACASWACVISDTSDPPTRVSASSPATPADRSRRFRVPPRAAATVRRNPLIRSSDEPRGGRGEDRRGCGGKRVVGHRPKHRIGAALRMPLEQDRSAQHGAPPADRSRSVARALSVSISRPSPDSSLGWSINTRDVTGGAGEREPPTPSGPRTAAGVYSNFIPSSATRMRSWCSASALACRCCSRCSAA
jgi:hypothetical protein